MRQELTVAAIQMDCEPGDVAGNLAKAQERVREAAARGAALALLPELAPIGYRLTEAMWACAEPLQGPTTRWPRDTAAAHQVFVGLTFLEVEGEHFYDTFVLAGPDGTLYPPVRKAAPAGPEAFFFAAGSGPRCFDTPLGRIGVGICFENFLAQTLRDLVEGRAELILQPFSAPRPHARFPLRALDVRISDAALRDQPAKTAQALGVPVVKANRCGPFVSPMPGRLPGWNSCFPGLSAVVDGDGVVLGRLAEAQGMVVGAVRLDPARKAG